METNKLEERWTLNVKEKGITSKVLLGTTNPHSPPATTLDEPARPLCMSIYEISYPTYAIKPKEKGPVGACDQGF